MKLYPCSQQVCSALVCLVINNLGVSSPELDPNYTMTAAELQKCFNLNLLYRAFDVTSTAGDATVSK